VDDVSVVRRTGWFGLVGFAVFLIELVLRILPGSVPLISDAVSHTRFLAENRGFVVTWVLLDMAMYACLMVFFAGFRHLIIRKRAEYEWVGTLALVAGAVWWAVSLVADGLQGGAILETVGGTTDPTVVKALVEGTLLIYNGAIAFAVTGLFMALAGYAILGTEALPKWVGWLAWVSAVLCVMAIPSMYVASMDHNAFYNAVGWGPMVVANVPPLIWFLVASILMVRKSPAPTNNRILRTPAAGA
jgi:hypothetical protein